METPLEIVIVDQCPRHRAKLQNLLNSTRNYYCLRDYPSGELLLADAGLRRADILIIDMILPGMSGLDLIIRLRPTWNRSRFLILSDSEQKEHIFEALRVGVDGYLSKQTQFDVLLASLAGMRNNEFPLSGAIARIISQSFRQKTIGPGNEHSLTFRETEVLNLVRMGFSNKEVATKLSIAPETVKAHLRNIYEKLDVSCRMEAASKPGSF